MIPDPEPAARLRALIYNRVSSDPTGRAISVASQEKENRAFCERQGWIVERVITDNDRSASRWATQDRPGYKEAHAELGSGRYDVFVCWESSRAHRDVQDFLPLRDLCERTGVLFAYGGRVYDMSRTDDRFTTTMDAVLAEREADMIRDRVKRGVDSSAALGKPHGHVPYGYRRIRDARTGVPIEQVPDEQTAPVVREIVAAILAGDTLHAIALRLNARDVPTPQRWRAQQFSLPYVGEGWTSSKIRALFKNPTRAGVRSHKEKGAAFAKEIAGTWQGIVDEADYWQVRRILADPTRAVHHRGVAVKHLLSGIAVCGVCGAWLRPQRNRGVPSYFCGGRGPGTGKGHVFRAEAPLDAFVILAVIRRLEDPGLWEYLARARSADSAAVEAAKRELLNLTAQQSELESAWLAKEISIGAFGRMEASVLADMEAVQARISAMAGPHPILAEAAGPGARARWDEHADDIGWQRQVVRATVRVVVHRSTRPRGAKGFDPGAVEIRDAWT